MVEAFNLADQELIVTAALPNGADEVTTASIDLGHNATGHHLTACELRVRVPLLTATQLPDLETMTYDVIDSDAADLSDPTVVAGGLIVQEGDTGAAAVSERVRLSTDVKRFIGVRVTNSGTGNASGVEVEAALLF